MSQAFRPFSMWPSGGFADTKRSPCRLHGIFLLVWQTGIEERECQYQPSKPGSGSSRDPDRGRPRSSTWVENAMCKTHCREWQEAHPDGKLIAGWGRKALANSACRQFYDKSKGSWRLSMPGARLAREKAAGGLLVVKTRSNPKYDLEKSLS